VNLKRHGFLVGAALTATLALAACGTDNNSGSSTPTGGSSSAAKIDCGSGKLTAQGSSAQKNAIGRSIEPTETGPASSSWIARWTRPARSSRSGLLAARVSDSEGA